MALVAAPILVEASQTLGLVVSTLNNPFFVTLKEGAVQASEGHDAELVVYDAQDDSAKMASAMEDLIQKDVDAILVNPTDANAVVPSILKANRAGIPVFTIDRGAEGGKVVCHIASDNGAGGKMAGKYLAEQIGGSGKVVELVGIPGTSAARDRGKGFHDAMDQYPDIELVASQAGDFNRDKGMTVFENILQAQPEIDGVFAHNDEMVLGAIAAAEAAGREGIVFVGFDAVDDAVEAVEAGKLAATVAQQPAKMGSMGVDNAVKYLKGQDIPGNIPVPLKLITQ
ncbi:MAG: D-ribose ABC transporter substrate-binding protein [Synergistales bacterium]|nr:D-ribose ABC transporter substrate-binding protein [Synergistales bacterium]